MAGNHGVSKSGPSAEGKAWTVVPRERRHAPLQLGLALQIGFLRTIFLADYLVNPHFRREILRVLNRGKAINSLKWRIYTGRESNYQAKHAVEVDRQHCDGMECSPMYATGARTNPN